MTNDLILSLLEATPGWARIAADAGLEKPDVRQILDAAERLATGTLDPLAARADLQGCQLVEGRVRTPAGYAATYRRMAADGWLAADLGTEFGGQGLPHTLHVAASLHFEGAATPFMKAAGASRAGAHLLSRENTEIARDWVRALSKGTRTATICISEPDAGSDVGRIRTRATRCGDVWQISGTKCWISFGDHDMTEEIGHLLLARSGAPEEGTRGLSLFLVPSTLDGRSNGITVERIETKLGLHGSPTCVLGFDGARGYLVGETGHGLSRLFGMIELMRLQVACQGAGIALRAAALARRYAEARRQGGNPAEPPVAIATHPDVRRMLAELDERAALLVSLVLDVAVALDTAASGGEGARERAALLLPIAKTFCGEGAFAAASSAIQVLGAAGYTRDWPAERYLRDSRILTIYEGTTGMQAQDFLFRRLLRDDGRGMERLLSASRAELHGSGRPGAELVTNMLDTFESMSARVARLGREEQLLAAHPFLEAGWCAVSAVLWHRFAGRDGPTAEFADGWLKGAAARLTVADQSITASSR